MKQILNTISKHPVLIMGIGIATFIAYSQLNAHIESGALINIMVKERSVAIVDGRYTVDTSFIRNNLNKVQLIADLEKQKLEQKKTVQEVPDFIWRFLDSISSDKKFDIVSPGEEYKEGITNYGHVVFKTIYDPVKKDSVQFVCGDGAVLPNKQLVYFGVSSNIALMSYEHGGTGPHSNILIFKFKSNKITDFWYGGIWYGDSMKNKYDILKSLKTERKNDGC